MKRAMITGAALVGLACLLAGCAAAQSAREPEAVTAAIAFVDDDGRQIALDEPCERIISLYSAHTENLYSLGCGERLIGAHNTSIYPPEAARLPVFSYDADPEKIIAAEPDLVLTRPFISRKAPDLVAALENAGLTVVSLYPETLADFDEYIERLGQLTGTEEAAAQRLAEFHQSLADLQQLTANVPDRTRVFLETTEVDLRTATAQSMAGQAIVLAGGDNVAADAAPITAGSSIAAFGAERILALAEEIDVYVSQRGAMNAGGSPQAISTRPGFATIKAVAGGRVYTINEKLISSPTFRYVQGVWQLARYLYPERLDGLDAYQTDEAATKADWAHIIVKSRHLPIYVPASSKYYQQTHEGHVYGLFADVPWTDSDFNAIETVVQAGYLPWERKDGQDYFMPDAPVTRDMLAKSVFLVGDFAVQEQESAISDLAQSENQRIVQILVDNGVFALTDGCFQPERPVTKAEIVAAFAKLAP